MLKHQRQELIQSLDNNLNTDALDEHCVLAIIDIREFRELNHSFGIACGDAILQAIESRLSKLALENTQHFYLGSDEFAILFSKVTSPGVSIVYIESILSLFKQTFDYEQHNLKITVNCGVAHNFAQHSDTNQIISDAEIALKQSKQTNQPYIWLEKDEQQKSNRPKWRLLNSLHKAMEDDELSLYLQPKVPLGRKGSGSSSCGAEGLIRWESIEHGILSPQVTLPLIEHLGSETALVEWLVSSALKYLQELDQLDTGKPELADLTPTISINVPPSLETTRVLPQIVGDALSLWAIDPRRLTLEITEDVLIQDKQQAFNHLSKIRDLGVRISIDDFGTGYSSLSYFKHIPADELKIDQSFISNILSNEGDRQIVRSIIDIAHVFDLRVIAEGVEDKETADLLLELGCDYAQGFYYSKPIPKDQYIGWLSTNRSLYN